ncbi:hypothetical protein ABIE09_000524 [Lysobacter enzymogenes]|uniref:hypothetical protein n=1 Tax=Lysobacter enzymogenes TaxID=69 RepID=UPI003399F962
MANTIKNLNKNFRVDASEPAATSREIDALKNFSPIPPPDDYLEIVEQATSIEICIGNGQYIRIWGPKDCVELNHEYEVQKYIKSSLAVGDDEGGNLLIIMAADKGHGLYKVSGGDLDAGSAQFVSESLTSLLIHGQGADVFWGP